MDKYVAEIAMPAPVYMPVDERKVLGEPAYYGCRRAYWAIDSEVDENGTPRPLGILLTAELEATDLESAEDASLDVGLRFSQVLASYSGSPLPTPKLKRLGRIGSSDGLLEQYDYYYLDGPEALPRVMLRPHNLEKLLSWFGSLDEPTAYRLELAARWYGMSVGAQDPLDGYLAVWIGIESVGPAFGARVHQHGTRAPCRVCGNQPGIIRNKGEAGIEHAIKEVAPELLQRRALNNLKDLRNEIAHGLKPTPPLRLAAEESLSDLQLTLIYGILTTARSETSTPGSGRAILPRNFKIYPEARFAVRSQVELVRHRPFFGEWLHVERRFAGERSRLGKDGSYHWGARTTFAIEQTIPKDAPTKDASTLERQYVLFKRRGHCWNLESDEEHPPIPVVAWRATPISPGWKRYVPEQGN